MGKYITLLEAVIMVGGFEDVAAPNRTTVTRIEDGKEKTMTIDLNKVKKGNKSLDILLKTGDISQCAGVTFLARILGKIILTAKSR